MDPRTIVIVGGVAGGASAATRARRLDEAARIIMFEKDDHVSIASCGLPYYVGGEIPDRSRLLVVKPDLLERRFRIEVRTGHEVIAVEPARKIVWVRRLVDGVELEQGYDQLILAPGATPVRPAMPGMGAANIFTLRNLPDTDRLRAWLDEWHPARAVMVGAGFIGLEMVEQLARQGLRVALVEMAPQVLPALDPEMAAMVSERLETQGVEMHLGAGVSGVRTVDGLATHVELTSGELVAGEVVLLGMGVRANADLARAAGLEIGELGGIRVNGQLQTSDPYIHAVGDAVELRHQVSGRPVRASLAGPATRAGRLAGEHAVLGTCRPMAGVNGTAIVRVFDVVAAMTGLGLRAALQSGLDAEAVIVEGASHAGYYPGAQPLVLKLVYDRGSGRILGGQAVGGEGVDKRIDVIATAIRFGGRVQEMTELDLCYAPPFGSVRDPLHQAAFAASNALAGLVRVLPPDADLSAFQVVDVRTVAEVAEGMVAGAVHVPLDELRDRLGELDPSRETAVICRSGLRGSLASRILAQHGFARVHNVTGGMLMRRRALHPTPVGG